MPPNRVEWDRWIVDRLRHPPVVNNNGKGCRISNGPVRGDHQFVARAIGARLNAIDSDFLDLEALQVEVKDIKFIDSDSFDGYRCIENVRIDIHIDRERVMVDVVTAVSECWVQRVTDTCEVRGSGVDRIR